MQGAFFIFPILGTMYIYENERMAATAKGYGAS